MKAGKTLIFLFIVTFCTFILFAPVEANSAPKTAIKSTIESILNILRDKNLSLPDKKAERRDKMRALIRDRFNFQEMGRRILARHWKKRTSEEQKEFVSVFSELLEASYISKIEAYTDEKVTYDKESIKSGGKYAMVSTTIATKKVDIPIDYKVKLRDSKWWIYDVVIEGVSFVSTYRSQYGKILKQESFAKLIQKMKNKLKEINAAT